MADSIFTPSNANTLSVVIGVPDTLEGFIIQSENITQTTPTLEIQDQHGRVAQVIAYDKQYTISMTAIGPNTTNLSVGTVWNWHDPYGNDLSCIVTSVERACTYNDTAKWNIQATANGHAKFWNATETNLDNYQNS